MPFKVSDTSALIWDFNPIVEASGVTPEPDPDAVAAFQYGMRTLTRGLVPDDVDTTDPDAMAKALDNVTKDDYKAMNRVMVDLVAELTAGCPSREQIAALGFRMQRAYIASLMSELMDPTPATAAMKSGPVAARNA